jgi:hypothetical protein
MTFHGRWDGQEPHRPLISATFSHPRIDSKLTLPFIVDTGADKTFIVPEHQRLLNIHPDLTPFETEPVHTISGTYPFNYLTGCSLIFTGLDGSPHKIDDITIYFPPTRKCSRWNPLNWISSKKKNESLVGEGDFPSILGRDILQKLSVGYCKEKDYLFISQRNREYFIALKDEFPKPASLAYFVDAPFEIAEYEIEPHP